MIKDNRKNKILASGMKKFIPYILILIFVVTTGLFAGTSKVEAQATEEMGTCKITLKGPPRTPLPDQPNKTRTECAGFATSLIDVLFEPNSGTGTTALTPTSGTSGPAKSDEQKTAFEEALAHKKCSIWDKDPLEGCARSIAYLLFFSIPSAIMTISAYLFNALLGITISTVLYTGFIGEAWTVVRDLSNIFFIIILLYAAIEMILGIGHGAKKTIGLVVLMALLINFSLFFTRVVIDASNILALVFYNKIDVAPGAAGYTPSIDRTKTGVGEKNIGGNLVGAFNITSSMSTDMLNQKITLGGTSMAISESTSLMIAILIVTGIILLFASYAFFIAGLSFVGRLVELWILLIFSPFAFMSYALPKLSSVNGIGWESWSKKLIATSFMAPIFMFFMYLIAKISQTDFITGLKNGTGFITMLLMIIIPSMIFIILLMKATEYAKKGGGALAGMADKAFKFTGGLALGAATGGAALLGTGLIGGGASKLAGAKGEEWKEKAKEKGLAGWAARTALKSTNYAQKATFDVRKTALGGAAGKALGVNLQASSIIGLGSKDGGFKGAGERKAKELQAESELYKTGKTNAQVQAWSDLRQAEFDKTKEEARKKQGDSFNESEYEKLRPKSYSTADSLNHDRMNAFKNNLGLEGLFGSVVYSTLKQTGGMVTEKTVAESREYKKWESGDAVYKLKNKKPTVESINTERAKTVKMGIGAAAAIATGGVTGGLVASGIGAGLLGGGITGVALGGGFAGGHAMTESSGEKKFAEGLEKEFAKVGNVENRIKEVKQVLENQYAVLEKGAALEGSIVKAVEKNGVIQKDAEGKIVYKVNQENLSKEIAQASINKQDLESQIGAINRKVIETGGSPALSSEKTRLMGEMLKSTMNLESLTSLKGIEKAMSDSRIQLDKLTGQKDKIHDESHPHPEEKGGHAPAPKAAPTPKAEPHGDSGGPGGGDHH